MNAAFFFRLLAAVAVCLSTIPLHAQSPKSDTVFLLRETFGPEHHNIFIDPARTPDLARGENLKDILNQYLPELISDLGRGGIHVKHLTGHAVPRRWVALHQYQGKLYRYQPCDGTDLHTFITDSTLVDYDIESFPMLIESISFSGDSIVRIKSLYAGSNSGNFPNSAADSLIARIPASRSNQSAISLRRKTKTIFVVDPATKLAVWEEGLGWNLMVPAESASQYPLLVCDCGPDLAPDPEFKEFEQIELPLFCRNGVPNLRGQDRGFYRTTAVPDAVQPDLSTPH